LTTVGNLGCGTVGRTLGGRLLRAGHRVAAYDRDPTRADPLVESGAERARTPVDLGRGASLVISCLPDPEAVEAALADGLWSSAAPGTIHVETSTVGPACILRVARDAAKRRIRFLDAPLSRGSGSERGPRLTLFVGGDVNVLDLARPVLDVVADRIHYCGGLGQGQVAKLVNNLVAHTILIAVGEALALGVKAGGSLDLLRMALRDGTADNRVLEELLPGSAFRGDWRPGLRLALARKDMRLISELAAGLDSSLTLADRVASVFERADERGWSDLNVTAALRLFEESFGVDLRSTI
jgi:3-hydroxyisobutyrate dehydrogenase-like beta-hydroxyacid dehydrogenase